MPVLCRDNFWYWETVVLVRTLGLVAAQVFAIALDGFFQLAITLLILMAGGLTLAHCHPFEQEGPQVVQVCTVTLQAGCHGCHTHMFVPQAKLPELQDPVNAPFILDLAMHGSC